MPVAAPEVEGRALEGFGREDETGAEGAELRVIVPILAGIRQPGEGLYEGGARRCGEAEAVADVAGGAEAERIGIAAGGNRDGPEIQNARRFDLGAVEAEQPLEFPSRIRRPGAVDGAGQGVRFVAGAEARRLGMRVGQGD